VGSSRACLLVDLVLLFSRMDWFRDRSALAADYLGQLDRYDEAPGFLREMFSSQQHWLSRYDPNEDDMVDHGVTDEMFRTERYEELKNEMDHMGKGLAKQPTSKLVRERETGSAKYAQETGAHRTQMLDNFLPTYFRRVAARYRVRVYNGKFSNDGSLFITASFDKNIRVYETNPHEDAEWNLVQRVSAPSFQWTITDTDVSPDKRSLVFSSLTPEVNYVSRQMKEVLLHEPRNSPNLLTGSDLVDGLGRALRREPREDVRLHWIA